MSASEKAPAAHSAEYSPSEWPATKAACLATLNAARFEDANDRHRHGHQRRLGVFGQPQRFVRPFEHDGRELAPERRVDLVEHRSRLGKGVGKLLAHADGLAALAGKGERKLCHYLLPVFVSSQFARP